MNNKLKIFKEENFDVKDTICLLILIMLISGFFGFVYETIFYRIDLGYFVKRGSSFGPWIPIYVYGGLLITLLTYKFKNKPILVFLMNTVLTGIIEYLTGYCLLEFANKRLWDYNIEIWNFGNVNGFICLRSVLFFGISSLFLIYIIIPLLIRLFKRVSSKKIRIISYILLAVYLIDIVLYGIIK